MLEPTRFTAITTEVIDCEVEKAQKPESHLLYRLLAHEWYQRCLDGPYQPPAEREIRNQLRAYLWQVAQKDPYFEIPSSELDAYQTFARCRLASMIEEEEITPYNLELLVNACLQEFMARERKKPARQPEEVWENFCEVIRRIYFGHVELVSGPEGTRH